MQLKVHRTTPRAKLPSFAHEGDACFDMAVVIDGEHPPMSVADGGFLELGAERLADAGDAGDGGRLSAAIPPGETMVFHTGLRFETEKGYAMKVHVRSSTGIKRGLSIANGTGIIDTATYRGEVLVALRNLSTEPSEVEDGDRVAQAEIVRIPDVEIVETDGLTDTERGEGGFGSTGKR